MEKICEECWNEACKARSDEFREGKLPVCQHMQEHPEEWQDDDYCPMDEFFQECGRSSAR